MSFWDIFKPEPLDEPVSPGAAKALGSPSDQGGGEPLLTPTVAKQDLRWPAEGDVPSPAPVRVTPTFLRGCLLGPEALDETRARRLALTREERQRAREVLKDARRGAAGSVLVVVAFLVVSDPGWPALCLTLLLWLLYNVNNHRALSVALSPATRRSRVCAPTVAPPRFGAPGTRGMLPPSHLRRPGAQAQALEVVDRLLAQGDFERAEALLGGRPTEGDLSEWWLRQGRARHLRRDWPGALTAAEEGLKALKPAPSASLETARAPLLLLKADALVGSQRIEEAEALYLLHLKHAPQDPEALRRYALAVAIAGDAPKASALLDRAEALSTRDPHLRARLRWLAGTSVPGDHLNPRIILTIMDPEALETRIRAVAHYQDFPALQASWEGLVAAGVDRARLKALARSIAPSCHWSRSPWASYYHASLTRGSELPLVTGFVSVLAGFGLKLVMDRIFTAGSDPMALLILLPFIVSILLIVGPVSYTLAWVLTRGESPPLPPGCTLPPEGGIAGWDEPPPLPAKAAPGRLPAPAGEGPEASGAPGLSPVSGEG